MMRFLIADTFTTSLSKLTSEEQSFIKNTAFDLQVNPAHPGLQFHRVERAKDKNFWSVRSGRDLRIIIHKTEADFLLCFVDHHNAAYGWAERRKLQTHPETGAAQLVEIRQKVQEHVVPKYVETTVKRECRKPFVTLTESELLSYGVPPEWTDAVRKATEDSVFDLFAHLPAESAEALLEIATGGRPNLQVPNKVKTDPFAHPDAQRRFILISSSDELTRALEYPWDKWTVFLHPEQRNFVEKNFHGPARVSGSAGTGKTIVALHRAFTLAQRNPENRVLLSTFSDSLTRSLQSNLDKLISNQPRLAEQIEVLSLPTLIIRLFEAHFGKSLFATESDIKRIIAIERSTLGTKKFTTNFLWKEWEQIVDAWQIRTWEQYRVVPRLGRRTRLTEDGRRSLWPIFERVRERLVSMRTITESEACGRLETMYKEKGNFPYDFAVIDESQDISVPQLRLLASSLSLNPNGLFFAGDLGQRIFQQPFSWTALGVDIRGRSKTLRINYRTSQEIRQQSDRLLDSQFLDVDGNSEDRTGTISVFSGPAPKVIRPTSRNDECQQVAQWLREQLESGVSHEEICIIVRSDDELSRADDAAAGAGCKSRNLNDSKSIDRKTIPIATMHMAKGMEFRSVVVMACDDEVIPLPSRIESVGDDADLQEVYATERQLLYVACTRARDCLLVSGVTPASEFLDDFE
jgi:mRNA-degrading endonuclease RelE of RelBE toxin-antitoxin system